MSKRGDFEKFISVAPRFEYHVQPLTPPDALFEFNALPNDQSVLSGISMTSGCPYKHDSDVEVYMKVYINFV